MVNTLDNAAKYNTGIETARSITIKDVEAPEILNITEDKIVTEMDSSYGRSIDFTGEKEGIYIDNEGNFIEIGENKSEVTLVNNRYTYSSAFANIENTKLANALGGPGGYCFASFCIYDSGSVTYYIQSVLFNSIITYDVIIPNSGWARTLDYGVRAIVYI